MAVRKTTSSQALPVYFDVSQRVGQNCPNNRDDVMLVQYLLKKSFQGTQRWSPVVPPSGARIDGNFSYYELYSILHYQLSNAYTGRGGFIDGIISPTHGHLHTVNNVQYTIIYMNLTLGAFHPQVLANPSSDPDIPQALLAALSPRR
jgi:hypothetical protein